MRISSRHKIRFLPRRTSPPSEIVILSAAKDLLLLGCCTLLLGLPSTPAAAQTLARPGWTGSGISSEAWWHNAIFYRIDVKHFQDSDGDGTGDLPGITQRLDYLQSLGVDAIILSLAPDEPGFDDLLHDASTRHIRIVVALDHAANSAEILGLARLWLTRGAAGISIEAPLLAATAVPMHELRVLTDHFPGDRVLLAQPAAGSQPIPDAQLTGQFVDFPKALTPGIFPPAFQEASPITPPAKGRASAKSKSSAKPGIPLLESDAPTRLADTFASDPANSIGLQKVIATKMLTARGAVSLLYGQELGLPGASTAPPTMQWTPTNITPPKPEPVAEEPPQPTAPPPPENIYGAFKPYVPPKPKPKPPPMVGGVPFVDPNTLPGFSVSRTPGATSPAINAAVEDTDPNSMLNFYRRLIQLHHDNPSLRSGTPYVLNHDAEKALVWLIKAPDGSRTAATVIIAYNLTGKQLTLSLDDDIKRLHLIVGSLRPMAATWTGLPPSQPTGGIVLPPYSAYIGELYH